VKSSSINHIKIENKLRNAPKQWRDLHGLLYVETWQHDLQSSGGHKMVVVEDYIEGHLLSCFLHRMSFCLLRQNTLKLG
jgi:hypothetical protein